jgi:hypothetical protein
MIKNIAIGYVTPRRRTSIRTDYGRTCRLGARSFGGWIRVLDAKSLRFGVTTDTENYARAELDAALVRRRADDAGNCVLEM